MTADSIRTIVTKMGYTPVKACRCGKGAYAYFLIPAEQATPETIVKAKAVKGVQDANVNSLRKSLLAVTKTPVDRFLVACEAFGIDPFTILIDPNHTDETKRKGRTSMRSTDPPQSGDIATLNRKIDVLKADIDDLKKKYESLLSAHEALARRVSVNIENIKNCSVNIATDRQK